MDTAVVSRMDCAAFVVSLGAVVIVMVGQKQAEPSFGFRRSCQAGSRVRHLGIVPRQQGSNVILGVSHVTIVTGITAVGIIHHLAIVSGIGHAVVARIGHVAIVPRVGHDTVVP